MSFSLQKFISLFQSKGEPSKQEEKTAKQIQQDEYRKLWDAQEENKENKENK